jgi:hypothetical protein
MLQSEIRSDFAAAEDITLAGVNNLKYQSAVIHEAMRLWPAAPETQRRIVNKGGKVIAGKYVAAGTHVGVYHVSTIVSADPFLSSIMKPSLKWNG